MKYMLLMYLEKNALSDKAIAIATRIAGAQAGTVEIQPVIEVALR